MWTDKDHVLLLPTLLTVFCLKERARKVHDIEKEVWTNELADIHRVVDEELKAVRQMAAGMLPMSAETASSTLPPSYVCGGLETRQETDYAADSEDDDFDIDSMKLKLGNDEDTVHPSIPELYLAETPVVDGCQSLSWYVPVVFHSFMLFVGQQEGHLAFTKVRHQHFHNVYFKGTQRDLK